MNEHRHFLVVHSKESPMITFDHSIDAIYVYFKRKAKVAKTIERESKNMIVNVDLDSAGEVVGIEIIGAGEIEIGQILKKAMVRAPSVNWEHAALA